MEAMVRNSCGNFYYYNPFGTPLDSLTVLLFRNGNIVDSAISDPNGNYVFERLADATYNIQAKTHKTWSGVNATDAVKVKRHFAGSELFNSSIRLHAADVNISLNINTSDAVKITRRFVGSDTSFVQQDWIFEKPFGGDTINISPYFNDSVTVNGGNVHQDFTGLCTGDVNGSNVPLTGAKQNPEISIDHIGSIGVKPGNYFEIPVRVSEDYSIGAISMILKFPAEKVKVENVRLSNGEDVVYRINGDELRLGWFSKDRILDIRKNSDLLILFLRSELSKGNPGEFRFDLKKDPLCELADANGEVITNASMYMPFVFSGDDASIPIAGNPFTEDLFLYPNPANDELTVNYSLFADGNIKLSLFNMIGEKVIEILNNYELKGVHNLNINLGTLPAGVYKCRMLSGEGQIIRTLVILR